MNIKFFIPLSFIFLIKNINIDNIYYSIIDPYNQIRTNNLGASKSYRNNNDKYILKNNSSNSYRNRNINSYSPHNIKNIEYKNNYDLPHSQIKYENKGENQFFYKIKSNNIINHDKSENNMMEERIGQKGKNWILIINLQLNMQSKTM